MKLAKRIGLIAFAALVVVAVTWTALQTTAVQNWIGSQNSHGKAPSAMQHDQVSGNSEDITADSQAGPTDAAGASAGSIRQPPDGERGGHNGGNVLGLVEVGRNLALVFIASLAVGCVGWLARKFKPGRHPAPSPASQA